MIMEIVISVILLFVGIGVLVIIHICIVGRAFDGDSNIQGVSMVVQRRSIGMSRMSIEELNKLPCFDYMAGEKGGAATPVECAVCLENLKTGEKCRLLPNCGHSFHTQCIDSWLLKTPVCPVCRSCVNPPKIDASVDEEASVADTAYEAKVFSLCLFDLFGRTASMFLFFASRHVVVGRNSQVFLFL